MVALIRPERIALVAILLLVMTGCSDSPGENVVDPVASLGKGGGGKPGGDAPSAGNVITTFTDAGGDAIRSDGAGGYVTIKRKQEVESNIGTSGQHGLKMEDGRANRRVCVVFPTGADATIVSPADWNDLVTTSGGAVDLGQTYCDITTMHTRDHIEEDKLLGMDTDPATAQDDVQTSGGKLVLKRWDGEQSWQWRLLFDDSHTSINGGVDSNGLCIRYNEDGTWVVGNDPSIADTTEDPTRCDGVDDLVNLIRVTAGGPSQPATYTHVATFRMPFSYTIVPLF